MWAPLSPSCKSVKMCSGSGRGKRAELWLLLESHTGQHLRSSRDVINMGATDKFHLLHPQQLTCNSLAPDDGSGKLRSLQGTVPFLGNEFGIRNLSQGCQPKFKPASSSFLLYEARPCCRTMVITTAAVAFSTCQEWNQSWSTHCLS